MKSKLTKRQLTMHVLMRKAAAESLKIVKKESSIETKYFVTAILALEWGGDSCLFSIELSDLAGEKHTSKEITVTLSESERNRIETKMSK